MPRFSERPSDPGSQTCQGQQELCGVRPRRAQRWAKSSLELVCCHTPPWERCLPGRRHGAGSWMWGCFASVRGGHSHFPRTRVLPGTGTFPAARGPGPCCFLHLLPACLLWMPQWKQEVANTIRDIKPCWPPPGTWLGAEFPLSTSL